MTPPPAARIIAISPYGKAGGYSGPSVFYRRLFSKVAETLPVIAVTSKTAPPPEGFSWASQTVPLIDVDQFGAWNQMRWFFTSFTYVLVRSKEHDVVHVHGVFLFNLGAALAALLRGHTFVLLPLSARDLSRESKTSRIPGSALLKRLVVSRATAGLALSDEIAESFLREGLDKNRLHRINNIVADISTHNPPSNDTRGLLFVGSITRSKGVDSVLLALSRLRQSGMDAHATFVGPYQSEKERRNFEETVTELSLSRHVRITGYVHGDEEVAEEMLTSQSSLFVLPSKTEGMPGSLAEAMALGFPFVVTDVGSMGDIARASGGGIVVGPHPEEIAKVAEQLWLNPTAWDWASSAAQLFAQRHFGRNAVAKKYINIVLPCTEGTTRDAL